jgi:predicted alpha/beta superfamily hydrolase
MKRWLLAALLGGWVSVAWTVDASMEPQALSPAPLSVGETFTVSSKVLNEERRINVYSPTSYAAEGDTRLPVLYMPDGGIKEDFLHVAGLVQVLVGNGTMRPVLLVGIENTERRRDLTGPTSVDADREIAPRVGGSKAFRQFIREELMPVVRSRYRTTAETAIVGESLAGLFVVETFMLEPGLFDTYIAFDPSLWWNHEALVNGAPASLARSRDLRKTIYLVTSDQPEISRLTQQFAAILQASPAAGLVSRYEQMPTEQHQTIYHPAALKAFREVFKPVGK